MKTTVTISISRDVEGEPMTWARWQEFASRVEVPFYYWPSVKDDCTVHIGRAASVNDSWDGSPVETYTWVADVPATELDGIVLHLAVAANSFGKEAIAVTVGETRLVGPKA